MTLEESIGVIEADDCRGHGAYCGQGVDGILDQLEVVRPAIDPRVEEPGQLAHRGVNRSQVAAPVALAENARRHKVVDSVAPPCFSLMMWSTWQPMKVSAPWIRQYSQR